MPIVDRLRNSDDSVLQIYISPAERQQFADPHASPNQQCNYRTSRLLQCYVNGIPLVFIELKNSNIKLKNAFEDNITNYKREVPQLFLTNAFCVLTNAIETKVGSITAEWEHFFTWLRAEDEKQKIDRKQIEKTGTSLESVIGGLFPPDRLLDYVENFVLFYNDKQKIIAQNTNS